MAHTVYMTYEEYQDFGGTEDSSTFRVLEFKSRKFIDYLTDCRVQDMTEVPEAVKLCQLSLMAMEAKAGAEAQVVTPAVTAFSVEGYSEKYDNLPGVDAARSQMADVVRSMLYGETDDYGTPLLYLGVSTT